VFGRINEAINDVFLGGRFESRPLHLVLDNEGRKQLGGLLQMRPDEVEGHCCSVVARNLAPSGDPYSEIDNLMRRWVLTGRENLPPFTALLYVLSHAAELMVSDGDFRASNYYQRLSGLVAVSTQRLSLHGRSTAPFWRTFSEWLADTDFRYGRPTARAVNANKYVGVAMSQAIVREEDRQRLHDMFEKYGFSGTDEITETEVEQYVSTWVTTSRPTRQFKATWRKDELRRRICEVVVAELDEWKSEVSGERHGSERRSSRLSLVLAYRHGLLSRSANIWLGRETSGESVLLETNGGTHLELGNSTFGGFATLEPRSSISLGPTLLTGISLTAGSGERFSWDGRATIPFSRSEHGSYWTEVNRVSLGVEHVVLVRDERKLRGVIETALEEVAIPGYTVASPNELTGVPRGWVLYEGVRVFKALEEIKGFEAVLSPIAGSAGLKLEGGTRLARGIWHAWRPPLTTFDGETPPTRLRVFEGTTDEGGPIAERQGSGRQVTIDLANCLPESGNVFIEGSDAAKVIGNASLLFRSANRPRPLDRRAKGILAHGSLVSAAPLRSSDPMLMRGFDVPPVPVATGHLGILDQFRELGPFDKDDPVTELEVSPVQDDCGELIDTRGMTPAELQPLPCAVRGFHWLRYATVPSGSPKHAPVDVTCSHCKVAYLHHRKQPSKQSRARASARRAVPRSPAREAASESLELEMDLWLDAAGFLGTGSVAAFEEVTSASGIDAWRTGPILRDLSWLGHLDIEIGSSNRPRAWSVSPPTLAFLGPSEAVLAGFRSQSLVAAIRKRVMEAGGQVEVIASPIQPAVVKARGLAVEAAVEALSGLVDPHGRSIAVIDDAPTRIASFARDAGGLFNGFAKATIGWTSGLQWFDLERGRWKSVDAPTAPGAYRMAYAGTTYVYRDSGGSAFTGTPELVKLAAARAGGMRLHAFDQVSREFSCRLGCEPPGLLGRALVACSGELPRVQAGTSTFARVPATVAALVLSSLYEGGIPS